MERFFCCASNKNKGGKFLMGGANLMGGIASQKYTKKAINRPNLKKIDKKKPQ